MGSPLLTFGARSVAPEILERTLVGRKEIIDRIEKELTGKVKRRHTYQSLVIAPRGSGKTHMMAVLFHRLRKNEKLRHKMLIAFMVEDEIGIANFLDFMVRILESLQRHAEPGHGNIAEGISEVADMPARDQEAAMKNLLLSQIGDRKLVVMLENIDIVFDGMKEKGQSKLRDFMHEYNNICLVASSQNLSAHIQDSKSPFYNFFKTIPLPKLSLEQAFELMETLADVEGRQDVLDDFKKPENRGKVRAVYTLTGGNHRLLVSFYSFMQADMKSDLSEVFVKTMNDLKPYYEQFVKALSAQQQKIVKHLSLNHTPQMGKDIARSCFIPSNVLSKQMSELYAVGMIDKHREGKDVYYELREPLMRICFEITENRDGVAKLFVDFLSAVYSEWELLEMYLGFQYGARLQSERMKGKYLKEASLLRHAVPATMLKKMRIPKALEEAETIEALQQQIRLLIKREGALSGLEFIVPLFHVGNIEAAERVFETANRLADFGLWVQFPIGAFSLYIPIKDDEQVVENAINAAPKGTLSRLFKANALARSRRNDEVFQLLESGFEHGSDPFVFNTALLMHAIVEDRVELFEKSFNRLINAVENEDLDGFHTIMLTIIIKIATRGTVQSIPRFWTLILNSLNQLRQEHLINKLLGSFGRVIAKTTKFRNANELLERLAILRKMAAEYAGLRSPVTLLDVAIRYVKQGDKRAIYDLSKEERQYFKKEILGEPEDE